MGVQGLNQHKRKYSRRWFETKVKGIVKNGLECEMEDVLDLNKKGRREEVTNEEIFEERISRQKGNIRKITKYIQIHHNFPPTSLQPLSDLCPTPVSNDSSEIIDIPHIVQMGTTHKLKPSPIRYPPLIIC